MNLNDIFNIDELKQKVCSNYKMKLIHIVWICLQYIQKHPHDISNVGIFWFDDSHFMINSLIFGKFTNRKPNTINRNFRTHGFKYQKTTYLIREKVQALYPNEYICDPKNWVLRWCTGFTKKTSENDSMAWKYIELIPKNKRKVSISPQKNAPSQENTNNLIENDNNWHIFDSLDQDSIGIFNNDLCSDLNSFFDEKIMLEIPYEKFEEIFF